VPALQRGTLQARRRSAGALHPV